MTPADIQMERDKVALFLLDLGPDLNRERYGSTHSAISNRRDLS
jgi:hypothetical protein